MKTMHINLKNVHHPKLLKSLICEVQNHTIFKCSTDFDCI